MLKQSNSNVTRPRQAEWVTDLSSTNEEARALFRAERLRNWQLIFGFVSALILHGFVLGFVVFLPWLIWLPWAPSVFLLPIALLVIRNLTRKKSEKIEDDIFAVHHRAIEAFGSREAWIVELALHRDEVPIGTDEGLLWIEDGKLYFSGIKMSFGLTTDLVDRVCRKVEELPGLRHPILMNLTKDDVQVSFGAVTELEQSRNRHNDLLRFEVDRWLGEAVRRGGQLPPLSPEPGRSYRGTITLQALAGVSLWLVPVAVMVKVWTFESLFCGVIWLFLQERLVPLARNILTRLRWMWRAWMS